jgi:hypothetical protein|tara:strand:- start:817 stop:1296 length:480 start_codon:yes stop_codon:yes gene_type:complete
MKFNDDITLSMAKTVSDVLEGKVKKEEVKYPHMMYAPDGSDEVEVKDKAEHDKYAAKGYVHEKPKSESPEEPRAKGEKDFKDKHVIKKSGEKEDGTVVKEKEEELSDESERQEKYKKVFAAALKKFGVSGIGELDKEKKKEFFNYVDSKYDAKDEQKKS